MLGGKNIYIVVDTCFGACKRGVCRSEQQQVYDREHNRKDQ